MKIPTPGGKTGHKTAAVHHRPHVPSGRSGAKRSHRRRSLSILLARRREAKRRRSLPPTPGVCTMPRPTKPTPTEPTSTAQQPETPAVNRRGFMQGVAAAAAASALATSLRAGENGSESGKGAAGAAPRKTPPKRFPIMLSDAPGFISAREAALDILKPTQAQLET